MWKKLLSLLLRPSFDDRVDVVHIALSDHRPTFLNERLVIWSSHPGVLVEITRAVHRRHPTFWFVLSGLEYAAWDRKTRRRVVVRLKRATGGRLQVEAEGFRLRQFARRLNVLRIGG